MMRKCLKLIRIQLKGILASNQFSNSKGKKAGKTAAMLILMAIVGLVVIFYSSLLTVGYVVMGIGDTVMPLMMAITSVFILFTTMFKANGFIFCTKDNDLLMSLPVKNWAIIVSRFASLYIYELMITAVFFLPPLIVYEIMCGFNILYALECVVALFFIPLIPLALATLAGIVVTYISARFRYKNLVILILGTLLFMGIMYFSFAMPQMKEEMFLEMNTVITTLIERIYPPVMLFSKGLSGNAAAYLGYLFVSLAVAGVIIALIAWRMNRLSAVLSAHKTKGNFKMTRLRAGGVFKALLMKECKRYFSSVMYVMNTALIYVIMIVGVIAMFFIKDVEAMLNIPGAAGMIGSFIPMVISFFAGITSTTSASLSLEGKHLWLLPSFPVSSGTIFRAKIALNLILCVPTILLCSILCIIRFRLDVIQALFTLIIPMLYGLLAAVGGMYMNIRFPNFNWSSEAVVIKQSAATMIVVFGGMIFVAIPSALLLATSISPALIYGVTAVILALLIIFSYIKVIRTSLLSLVEG